MPFGTTDPGLRFIVIILGTIIDSVSIMLIMVPLFLAAPFALSMCLVVILVVAFPQLTTFLVNFRFLE